MSSVAHSTAKRRDDMPGRRAAFIARSISWSFWWRKLVVWLCIDVLFVGIFLAIFAWHGLQSLPVAAQDGITDTVLGITFVRATNWTVVGTEQALAMWVYRIVDVNGTTYNFPLAPYLNVLQPFVYVGIALQLIDLLDVFFGIRRIRRRLQPLHDLAAAAEAARSAAFGTLENTEGTSKMAALEAAIERTSIDAPQVSTGDADLAGIEIALNRLLRQMQQAKLQQMRFVSDASHELRTPIAVIQGYVNLLDRWGKTDAAVLNESIEALKTESEHMQELVEQLLFLARGDSGRNTLQRTRINLASLVHEVWEESSMIDSSHRYLCNLDMAEVSDASFELTGDLALLKQSIRIIVQNAAKYSHAGTTITLSACTSDTTLSYQVSDEGLGMSEADISHIFERFYRASGAFDENTPGSGLGLSIAKWIIDAHGGTIDVLSSEGIGTRFSVTLPR